MKSLPVASIAIGACLLVSSLGLAFAANPHNTGGTGPTGIPNKTCGSSNATGSPGHAALSPGSVFNEPSATSSGGTGGAAYNAAGAPSQYDVACFQTQVP
jgi:hypothetical protein